MMDRIAAVRTTTFRLPMRGSLRWGSASQLDAAEHVLVELVTAGGIVGMAEAPPRPTIYGETPASIHAIVRDYLAPRIVGLPLDDVAGVNRRLDEIASNQTARGALDMALHDALAQARGVGLGQLLGATRARVRVSFILGIADRRTMLAEAAAVYAQGVRVLKVKVGRDFAGDLATIDALRRELPEMELYADANECLDPARAAEQLRALADHGLRYVEEPLPVECLAERAALRRQAILPLIADDSAFDERDLTRELAADSFDILNIKTARTGYYHSARMAARAVERGKGVMVGSQASTTLGTARAGLFAARPEVEHPSELSFFLKLTDEIVCEPLALHDGWLEVAALERVRVDPARLRRFAVD
jgi:L-alanine-DL-glutamate epimerase-like enolase superfamily enzyme